METSQKRYHLFWISDAPLGEILHSARCLYTTQAMRDLGWDVTLITSGYSGEKEIQGVKVHGISCPSTYLIRQAVYHLKVISFLWKQKVPVDFVLTHQISSLWTAIPRLIDQIFKGRSRPLYLLDTRTLPMAPEDKITKKDRIRYLVQDFIDKWGHRWSDGRTAITQRMAEVVGIPQRKNWGTWPSGVVQDQFGRAIEKRTYPGDDDVVELIYIGCMHYERNLMTLSKSVVQANKEGMKFRLTLVGDGNEKADLEKYALGTNGQVRVHDQVNQAEIPEWLAKAHVGVLAFPDEVKFQVSSPIKLFEYMASGLPIMATRIACHTDVLGEGDFVFWAEKSDESGLFSALCEIWRKRMLLPSMGEKSALEAPLWTWKESARKLMKALDSGYNKFHSSTRK